MRNRVLLFCSLLTAAALLPLHAESVARDTLRGRVVDRDGAAVSQVHVQLVELGRSATTDRAGEFVLTHLPHGQQTVLVRRPGYAPIVRHIDLDTVTALNFALEPAPFELEPLSVTATGSAIP